MQSIFHCEKHTPCIVESQGKKIANAENVSYEWAIEYKP